MILDRWKPQDETEDRMKIIKLPTLRMVIAFMLCAVGASSQTQASECAFVTNQDSGSVSVIDTATNTATRTIHLSFLRDMNCTEVPLPGAQPHAIAISPDGARAYVTMLISCYVVTIDTRLSRPIDYVFPIPGLSMGDVVVSPNMNRVYVASQRHGSAVGTLLVLDALSGAVIATPEVGYHPTTVAVRPDGRSVYVAGLGGFGSALNTISVIDAMANVQTASVELDSEPGGVAVTPDGRTVYVTTARSVKIIDANTDTLVASVPVAATSSSRVAITQDGHAAYISSCGGGTCVVDTTTNLLRSTIPVYGSDIALTADGAVAYLTNDGSDTISVVDTASNAIIQTISMPDCGRLYDDPPNPKAPCTPTAVAVASLPNGCPACAGDCNTDGQVTVDELMVLVNTALGNASIGACPAADVNHDGQVTVDEVLRAVDTFLSYPDVGSCWAGPGTTRRGLQPAFPRAGQRTISDPQQNK